MSSSHRREIPLVEAAHRLRLEAATAEVVTAFDAAAVPSILLKGESFGVWLYPDGPRRTFSDCDFLVRNSDRDPARGILRGLGFEPRVDEEEMPAWWSEHAIEWRREQDGVEVDLHRTIPGVGVTSETCWSVLSTHTEPFVVGGASVQALTIPGRAFHLALHIAQHGQGEWTWKLGELARAIEMSDDDVWLAAADIASELSAAGAFCAGLALAPGGSDVVTRLGLDPTMSVDVALRAAKAPPVALGFDQLANARGVRERARILWGKVFPPATFMRVWSPRARRGVLWLFLAYVVRPFWLLRRAPAGYRAWRDARRASPQ